MRFDSSLRAWGTPDFEITLKSEIRALDPAVLPLQEGLSQTSYVCDSGIDVLILNVKETPDDILVKTGIFYAGIIAGSCCADDPTPVGEQTEYCEVLFNIDKATGEATASLSSDAE